jgi:drug/metabolite transporter (DMT)-like permease
MTLTAVVLLLISAVTHAGWNLLGKREHPTAAFLLVANTLGCLCLTPALIFYRRALAAFPSRVWMLIGLTGLCQAIYYAGLAGAYRTGDMSVAHPLARSMPAIFVTLFTLIAGQGHPLSSQSILGITLIVAGSFLLPMKQFTDLRLQNYLQLSSLLALVAAIGTSGYSIIDDEALRHLRETLGATIGRSAITVLYSFLEGISSSLWLAVLVLARKLGRVNLQEVLRARMRQATLTGVVIYLTYTLVLISMAFVTNVSYIVAFRQLSIPLGTVLGVLILKEPRHAPKFVGVAIMFTGLVLVGTG